MDWGFHSSSFWSDLYWGWKFRGFCRSSQIECTKYIRLDVNSGRKHSMQSKIFTYLTEINSRYKIFKTSFKFLWRNLSFVRIKFSELHQREILFVALFFSHKIKKGVYMTKLIKNYINDLKNLNLKEWYLSLWIIFGETNFHEIRKIQFSRKLIALRYNVYLHFTFLTFEQQLIVCQPTSDSFSLWDNIFHI